MKKCKWFLGCKNNAVTTAPHPILGEVPVCQRCKDFIDGIKTTAKKNPIHKRKSKKKPVKRKSVSKPKVTTAKKNPRGRDYVIEGKFFSKSFPFFWNGNGFVNQKSNASRYTNIDNASSIQRAIKKRALLFPDLNFVRVVCA